MLLSSMEVLTTDTHSPSLPLKTLPQSYDQDGMRREICLTSAVSRKEMNRFWIKGEMN